MNRQIEELRQTFGCYQRLIKLTPTETDAKRIALNDLLQSVGKLLGKSEAEIKTKDLIEWLEDRGELVISKSDGGNFVVVARADGVMKTAEAATLADAIKLWEEQ